MGFFSTKKTKDSGVAPARNTTAEDMHKVGLGNKNAAERLAKGIVEKYRIKDTSRNREDIARMLVDSRGGKKRDAAREGLENLVKSGVDPREAKKIVTEELGMPDRYGKFEKSSFYKARDLEKEPEGGAVKMKEEAQKKESAKPTEEKDLDKEIADSRQRISQAPPARYSSGQGFPGQSGIQNPAETRKTSIWDYLKPRRPEDNSGNGEI